MQPFSPGQFTPHRILAPGAAAQAGRKAVVILGGCAQKKSRDSLQRGQREIGRFILGPGAHRGFFWPLSIARYVQIFGQIIFCRVATAIEYGLIAAGISVAIITAVQLTGTNLTGTFNSVANARCSRLPDSGARAEMTRWAITGREQMQQYPNLTQSPRRLCRAACDFA